LLYNTTQYLFQTASDSLASPQALDPKQNFFKDHASHFVLRLAYCRTEELRRWFLTHESELFKARFGDETPKAQASPVSLFNMKTFTESLWSIMGVNLKPSFTTNCKLVAAQTKPLARHQDGTAMLINDRHVCSRSLAKDASFVLNRLDLCTGGIHDSGWSGL